MTPLRLDARGVAHCSSCRMILPALAIVSCAAASTAVGASPPKLEWRALDATTNDHTCTAVLFEQPRAIAIDRDGNIYVTNEKGTNALQKISADGTITTLLDRGATNLKGQTYVNLSIAIDQVGRIILGVGSRGTVEQLGKDGALRVLTGQPGQKGIVNGSADKAQFKAIAAVAISPQGDIYIADSRTIRRVSVDGSVVTIAGNAHSKEHFLDEKGSRAAFGSPNGMVFDGAGNLYVADGGGFENEGRSDFFGSIRRVDPTGSVETLAGNVNAMGGHLDGKGFDAMLSTPTGVAIDPAGTIYFTDVGVGESIRTMDEAGNVTSLIYHVANYDEPSDRDGDDPIFIDLKGIAVGQDRELYVVDRGANKLHQINSLGFVKTLCAPATPSF